MYRDKAQWAAVRNRVLVEGASRRQVARETGISLTVVRKMLYHPAPPPPVRGMRPRPKLGPYLTTIESMLASDRSEFQIEQARARAIYDHIKDNEGYTGAFKTVANYVGSASRRKLRFWGFVYDLMASLDRRRGIGFLLALSRSEPAIVSETRAEALHRACKLAAEVQWTLGRRELRRKRDWDWMHELTFGRMPSHEIQKDIGDLPGLAPLLRSLRDGKYTQRAKALAVLANAKGIDKATICAFANLNKASVNKYIRVHASQDAERLFAPRSSRARKTQDETLKTAVFSVLHQPPAAFGFNRTSWRMQDLRRALSDKGQPAGSEVIREIVRAAGYRWRKARIALTSQDPDYASKVARIKEVLSQLSADEAFFSIDEFGPFAVRMTGGILLVPPGEQRIVPQRQRARGRIILTAALELSGNQVTHFYSTAKNTAEMIRMMEVLVARYGDRKRIFLSWDAASWHMSKELYRTIDRHNAEAAGKRPVIETVPLPAGAQFLNVIESVFSGMARAIVHNSDYASVDDAKSAIDRYFSERNEHFRRNPQRAGRKIWGKEREPPAFKEGNNCKAPEYCWGRG
jgi:transposase